MMEHPPMTFDKYLKIAREYAKPTTPAILTGSHAYGEPHEDSDIDLVVYMPPSELAKLQRAMGLGEQAKAAKDKAYGDSNTPLRFGPLNLLVCTSRKRYESWCEGTADLVQRGEEEGRPITRPEAVEHFSKLRERERQLEEGGEV